MYNDRALSYFPNNRKIQLHRVLRMVYDWHVYVKLHRIRRGRDFDHFATKSVASFFVHLFIYSGRP